MKWTLVTGGAKGLGAAICKALALKGESLLIHYCLNEKLALAVANECRSYGVDAEIIQGDFSSSESTTLFIEKCQKQYPDIKNLINNVGIYLIKGASVTTSFEWNTLFQINLHAPFALIHSMLPSIRQSAGNIINIGVVGINNIHADTHRTAYMATKMALWMLTKTLAKEVACSNVRVNMVSPGHLENSIDQPVDFKNYLQGRRASSTDVTNALNFLLEEENGYITGQNIEVGGALGLIH